MTIFNLGSINADYFYAVPHLPAPGETIRSTALATGLGGKGANQSVAAAKAGAHVRHIGAVGADGRWARDRMQGYGVDTAAIAEVDGPTGHAMIVVDEAGENLIATLAGANALLDRDSIAATLAKGKPGDIFLMQNETAYPESIAFAAEQGLKTIYSAAPFSVAAVERVIGHVALLVVNAVEAEQLCKGLRTGLTDLPVPELLVTKGADGADWHDLATGRVTSVRAIAVEAVDTTGAGDTYIGYLAAGLDEGLDMPSAMRLAAGAAALKVTRKGTSDAIPLRAEVEDFLKDRP